MVRLAVLGSTRGTHLLTLVNAIQQKRLAATIEVVISNKADALILERAKEHQLPAIFIAPEQLTRDQYDQKIAQTLQRYPIDGIVLVGYMRILSASFIKQWRNKIINVHPSLLPAFAGGMNSDVHRAVLASGVQETGCTVHFVNEIVDSGPILAQKKCAVLPTDTLESLKQRVQNLEAEALVDVLSTDTMFKT